MQDDIRLTPTSYIVLGLLEAAGEATPYDLKRMVAAGVGNFWSLQHAQLYTEPERLTRAGYLTEERERGGRRRKRYTLTAHGRRVLEEWVSTPTREFTELRDPGLLKLFFGADLASLAAAQLEVHERKLGEYEALRAQLREHQETRAANPGDRPPGPGLTLDAGIGHEREWIRFWRRVQGG